MVKLDQTVSDGTGLCAGRRPPLGYRRLTRSRYVKARMACKSWCSCGTFRRGHGRLTTKPAAAFGRQ